MACVGTGKLSELDYVRSLAERQPGQCRGPAVTLSIPAYRLVLLEDSFQAEWANDLLWDGYQSDYSDRVNFQLAFQLCSAHWMDLSYLSGVRAHQFGRQDWLNEASRLLAQTCEEASWDAKEISNLLRWQHVEC